MEERSDEVPEAKQACGWLCNTCSDTAGAFVPTISTVSAATSHLPLTWEKVFNPDFNSVEFDRIKSKAGLNNFRISAKEWTEKTHAIGIVSKAGRYGGTYAHKDIAFEFAMWRFPKGKYPSSMPTRQTYSTSPCLA